MPWHGPSKGAARSGLLSGVILFIAHLKYFAVSRKSDARAKLLFF